MSGATLKKRHVGTGKMLMLSEFLVGKSHSHRAAFCFRGLGRVPDRDGDAPRLTEYKSLASRPDASAVQPGRLVVLEAKHTKRGVVRRVWGRRLAPSCIRYISRPRTAALYSVRLVSLLGLEGLATGCPSCRFRASARLDRVRRRLATATTPRAQSDNHGRQDAMQQRRHPGRFARGFSYVSLATRPSYEREDPARARALL